MYYVGWLYFLTLEEWPSIEEALCVQSAHSLVAPLCELSEPVCRCGLTTMGSLVGLTGSCSVICQALLCVEADDQCLVGLNHKVNGN